MSLIYLLYYFNPSAILIYWRI